MKSPGASLHLGAVLYETGTTFRVWAPRCRAIEVVIEGRRPTPLTGRPDGTFELADLVPNHIVSTDVPAEVAGRAVICEPLAMYPVECVARGYLTGSGLVDYAATGEVCGVPLPAGLEDRLAPYADDAAAFRAAGLDVTTELCAALLAEGIPALHFYTLNRSTATSEVVHRLGLVES